MGSDLHQGLRATPSEKKPAQRTALGNPGVRPEKEQTLASTPTLTVTERGGGTPA